MGKSPAQKLAEQDPYAKIASLRLIQARHQYAEVEGHPVDTTTAAAILGVYDALSDKHKQSYVKFPIPKMADIAWKLIKKTEGTLE